MADEQRKPKVEFFIPPADATPEQSGPAVAPVTPPPHALAANAAALQAQAIVQQAQQQQLAEQKKMKELQQLQLQVGIKHRTAIDTLVSRSIWGGAIGVLLALAYNKWWR